MLLCFKLILNTNSHLLIYLQIYRAWTDFYISYILFILLALVAEWRAVERSGGQKISCRCAKISLRNGGKVIKDDTFFGAYFIFVFDLNAYSTFF